MYETDLHRILRVLERLSAYLKADHPDALEWSIELMRSDVAWLQQMLRNELDELME